MRVIAGSRRSLPLKTLPGPDIRPTTDKIKETLFNMMNPYLPGSRFLDLFAGSGAIGIEALSRGAAEAWFIDSARPAIRVIEENVAFPKFTEEARIVASDVFSWLMRNEKAEQPFDLIFMDPPYGKGYEKKALSLLRESALLNDESIIIVEALKDEDFSYLESFGFEMIKQKVYRTNQHVWLRKAGTHE